MRLALALASCLVVPALGGCFIEGPREGGGGGRSGGWGSGWGGGGGYDGGCQSDTECGTNYVCTRTGECLAPAQVRKVQTLWTVRGQPASVSVCTSVPPLAITFRSGAGEEFGYAPVPCDAGKHTVDKFPARFTSVQLAADHDYAGGDSATFDAEGTAVLDLPY